MRPLWERHGVSSIIVVGGAGDYFDVADSVVMMRRYNLLSLLPPLRLLHPPQPATSPQHATPPYQVMMDSYVPLDVTERARQIARDLPAAMDHTMLVPASDTSPFASLLHRCPAPSGITRDAKLYAGREALRFGELPTPPHHATPTHHYPPHLATPPYQASCPRRTSPASSRSSSTRRHVTWLSPPPTHTQCIVSA